MKFFISLISLIAVGSSVYAAKQIAAGPIMSTNHAREICPGVCTKENLFWHGAWHTVRISETSVCHCEDKPKPESTTSSPQPVAAPTHAPAPHPIKGKTPMLKIIQGIPVTILPPDVPIVTYPLGSATWAQSRCHGSEMVGNMIGCRYPQ